MELLGKHWKYHTLLANYKRDASPQEQLKLEEEKTDFNSFPNNGKQDIESIPVLAMLR